ncbi:MAG: hypothetical protein ACM3O5_10340 [Betaproteobacteria bacterium]
MTFRILFQAMVFALATIGPVAAQTPPAPRGSMTLPVDPQFLNDLPELKGVVPWRILGQVTTGKAGGRPVPEFSPDVRKLDQQDVRLQGYMLPIVAGETHDHFLLTMRPPHCPFCLSLGPEYIVEVKSRSPIRHTYEPVVVAGRLNVLRDDPFGLYYRLTDAQLSSASR